VTLEIFEDVEQNSERWFSLHVGIPTASEFHSILAKGEGKMRASYLRRKAGEILTGEIARTFKNARMDEGHTIESEARAHYALTMGEDVKRIGFARTETAGASPDGLIGDDGGVEFKSAEPHILIELIERDDFPSAHKAQVQGSLWVLDREWWDVYVYWPKMPVQFRKRAVRDVRYIAELAGEVRRFNDDVAALVERIRRFGQ
jgi:hypothetical protein